MAVSPQIGDITPRRHIPSDLGIDESGSQRLGQGSFGEVRTARLAGVGPVCIKCIRKPQSRWEKQNALKEIRVLSLLDHCYIVKYHKAYYNMKGELCIVMDLAQGGDLHCRIRRYRNSRRFLPDDDVRKWFSQACLGLRFMHSKDILHRDLKTANLFLTAGGDLLLGDFGIAKVLESPTNLANTFIGTPTTIAPELVLQRSYGKPADMWSLGCVLYEMLTTRTPFTGHNQPSLSARSPPKPSSSDAPGDPPCVVRPPDEQLPLLQPKPSVPKDQRPPLPRRVASERALLAQPPAAAQLPPLKRMPRAVSEWRLRRPPQLVDSPLSERKYSRIPEVAVQAEPPAQKARLPPLPPELRKVPSVPHISECRLPYSPSSPRKRILPPLSSRAACREVAVEADKQQSVRPILKRLDTPRVITGWGSPPGRPQRTPRQLQQQVHDLLYHKPSDNPDNHAPVVPEGAISPRRLSGLPSYAAAAVGP